MTATRSYDDMAWGVKTEAQVARKARKRKRAKANRAERNRNDVLRRLRDQFTADYPGHPLGRGMPMGQSVRINFFHEPSQSWRGESHRDAWMRMVREDPCAYCGAVYSGTADHIEPKSKTVRGIGGAHTWLNIVGACERCNGSKGDKKLLLWLRSR